ncbi:hypothetical protein OAS39_12075 [Pirellulales bacterium]|nr:hypothetical protein [Pirellulales bacterium]
MGDRLDFFSGCVMGFFLLGFLTTRVDYRAALAGVAVAIPVNLYLVSASLGWLPDAVTLPVHKFWIAPLVNITFIVVAYPMGWLQKKRRDSLAGLTVWT